MSRTRRPHRRLRVALVTLLGLTTLTGCGAQQTEAAGPVEVVFAVPSWVGGRANVAVARRLLEEQLDVTTRTRRLDPAAAWDALHRGCADVVLEDWRSQPEKEERYLERTETVVEGGDLGITGHVGWYVPAYYARRHPEVTDVTRLNELVDDFRTPETGRRGRLLAGSPVQPGHEAALVRNLGLDFEVVPTGDEAAHLAAVRDSYRRREPFLATWWSPHWLGEKLDLVEVRLPAYREGCTREPAKVDCAYPDTPLQKYLSAEFAEHGGAAATFVKRFTWRAQDQVEVARLMAEQGMSAHRAAGVWIARHRDVWQEWLP